MTMTENEKPEEETPAQENLLSMKSMAKDAARGAGGIVAETAGDLLFTGLLYASLFLAVILPVAGLVIGGLLLWRAIATGRSMFLPIMTLVASIAFCIIFQSPLGMLPLILTVL